MNSIVKQTRYYALLLAGLIPCLAAGVSDGLGTNYVGQLNATAIQLGGEERTQWTPDTVSVGGGPVNFRANSNVVFWSSAVVATGVLRNARVQTDQGTADINIVRSKWNDPLDTYTTVGAFQADSDGTLFTGWSSSWVSNTYRIGMVVTNFSTGTNLWWSVEYSQ
jgi:hypothetical protein